MPRNLSESHLVQASSKALSNVAGQFTRLGQSLNPNKNNKRKGNENAHSIEKAVEAAEKTVFTVGSSKIKSSASSSDSEDNENSIYEPDNENDNNSGGDITADNTYNENTFLPSVGIVMASNECKGPVSQLEEKDNVAKMSEDVLTISISSVMDHVSLPAGLLENASPIRPRSPAPDIRVFESEGIKKESLSAQETR